MVTSSQLRWGRYSAFEGPWHPGTVGLPSTPNPTPADNYLGVVTTTEGGHADGLNEYDSCKVSVGYIQLCETYYLTSQLLGALWRADNTLLLPLDRALLASECSYGLDPKGRFRFKFHDERSWVDSPQEQEQLFFGGASGKQGSWGEEGSPERERAKLWGECLMNTLAQPDAVKVQIAHLLPMLKGFALAEAKALLWGPGDPGDEAKGWVGAVRAAYLSFAANNPTIAQTQLKLGLAAAGCHPKWSKDWAILILGQMTFGPKVAIYPGRYDKIRREIELRFGVDLPDYAKELKDWQSDMGICEAGDGVPAFVSTLEIQEELVAEGYDLGPAGADGKMGKKTSEAVRVFQGLHGLQADGVVGPRTRTALTAEYLRRHP